MQPPREIVRITEDNIEDLVPRHGTLVLLACLRQDDSLAATIDVLATVARWFGREVETCFALDDLLAYLMDRFHFNAAPTFLLIRQGNLLAASSGQARAEDLIGFVRTSSGCQAAAKEA